MTKYCVIVTAKDGHRWPSCAGRLVGVQMYVRHEDAVRESERLRGYSQQQTAVFDNFTTERQVKRFCKLLNQGTDVVEAVRLAKA